jgi:hypothetical protein
MKVYREYYYKNEPELTVLYEFDSEEEVNASGLLDDKRRTTCFMSDGQYFVGGHFKEAPTK